MIIPITELRRNFGSISEQLVEISELILTKGGEPFAILKAMPSQKKKILKKAASAWKDSELDDDELWRLVFKRSSRKNPIAL